MKENVFEQQKKYINRKLNYSLELPESWARAVKESPGGDTVVLYNENGNLVRLIASKNEQNREFLSRMITDAFRTPLVTDAGLRGELAIGGSKNVKGRVIAWFYLEADGVSYHLVADLSPGFAMKRKELLVNLAKSLTPAKNR